MLDQKVKHISAMKFVTDQESRRFQFEFSLCTDLSLSTEQVVYGTARAVLQKTEV